MASHAARLEVEDQSKAKVFISYSRQDIAFADRLDAALKARGFEPLIDRTDIYAFEEWWKRIETLIGRADTVIFVLSPDAVRPGSVALNEIGFAASLNKRFAPIVFRRVEDSSVPDTLAKLNFISFDDAMRFEQAADQLAQALNTDIGWIRQHTEYGEAERRWSAAGHPRGLLLYSPTLEVAEHWIASCPSGAPEPTKEIQAFISASRKAARAAQWLRRVVLATMFTMLVGIIIGLIGWINQAYIAAQWNWWRAMRPYAKAQVWPHVLNMVQETALKPGHSFKECAKDCPEMIVVPAGEFTMGSPATEKGRHTSEDPQRRVTIARPFAVSKFDVTFDDWDACAWVGGCPKVSDGGFGRGSKPVVNVNWDEAQQYVAWFSKMTGQPYRLLTEAEWEYAARAGTTTAYFWGDEIGKGNANCNECGSEWDARQSSPVGSFKPNKFGLYDMAANVWQWVQDCYHDDYKGAPTDGSAWTSGDCSRRVERGGSWNRNPQLVRAASRSGYAPVDRSNSLGFRVGRTLTP